MHGLLHPPAHRGPLIAAGALVLTVAVALLQVRLDWGAGVQFAIVVALAVALLWLGLQAPPAGAAPYPHQSVLIVLALAASGGALLRLADVLEAFPPGSGTVAWTSAALGALAVPVSVRRQSAFAALVAAVAGGVAVVFALIEVADPSPAVLRWLLLVLAVVYGLVSLPLRATSLRHAAQMVNAAGLATLAIGFVRPAALLDLPAAWPAVVFVAGVSLAAYAAADRAAGAAYLGAANLAAFLVAESEGGFWLWPLLLLVIGGVMVAVGLRPRRPLPPEPDSSTHPDDTPLTVRVRRS